MNRFFKSLVLSTACAAVLGSAAIAQDASKAIEARQSVMKLYSHYLGKLGGMAKGNIEYDAESASNAAASLAALASLDQSAMWPQGSDMETLGLDTTAALASIWTTYPAVAEKGEALSTAAAAMVDAAGTDLASLQAAMGAVGQSCSGCHKEFRQKR